MQKRLFFIFVLFFIPFYLAQANIVINEIMYDLKTGSDDGREWIEVFNDGGSPVDLSVFKFFEADTNHKLLLIQGDKNIGAQNYAIIVSDPVKFKIDWFTPPNSGGASFAGTIFDSSFSLSNTGETLALKTGDQIIDVYSYQASSGGAGDGKSLQKINGVWAPAVPTPGVENKLPPRQSAGEAELKKKVSAPVKVSVDQEILTETKTPDLSVLPDDIEEENSNYSHISPFIFTLLLCASGGAIYFIRRKKVTPKTGDDFEILE